MHRLLITISILTMAGCPADPIGPTAQPSITTEATEVDARRIRGEIDGTTQFCDQIIYDDISRCPWRRRPGPSADQL